VEGTLGSDVAVGPYVCRAARRKEVACYAGSSVKVYLYISQAYPYTFQPFPYFAIILGCLPFNNKLLAFNNN
jgi:hypothetical protein